MTYNPERVAYKINNDKPAVLIMNCAVLGRSRKPVRKFSVSEVTPYAQYDKSVIILFTEPKMRKSKYFKVVPDNLRFYAIEQNGQIIYDSRDDIPVDAAEFTRVYEREKAIWQKQKGDELAMFGEQPGVRRISMSNFAEEIIL
jgi:hypothetical protein